MHHMHSHLYISSDITRIRKGATLFDDLPLARFTKLATIETLCGKCFQELRDELREHDLETRRIIGVPFGLNMRATDSTAYRNPFHISLTSRQDMHATFAEVFLDKCLKMLHYDIKTEEYKHYE
ncbi:hypothetical protein Hanom_Chr00s000008g01616141 [Helianthus anomalus]